MMNLAGDTVDGVHLTGLLFAVMLGGGLGAMARVVINQIWLPTVPGEFPRGTLLVNALGCLLLGLLLGLISIPDRFSLVFALFGFGLLGGFTTVSSLSLECLLMHRAGRVRSMASYLFISLLAGVGLAALGWQMGIRFSGAGA